MDEFRDECKWRSLGLDENSAMEENAIDLKVPEGRQDFIDPTLRQIKPEDQLEFFREISYALKRAARQLSADQMRIANKLIQLLHTDGFKIGRVIPLLAAVLF